MNDKHENIGRGMKRVGDGLPPFTGHSVARRRRRSLRSVTAWKGLERFVTACYALERLNRGNRIIFFRVRWNGLSEEPCFHSEHSVHSVEFPFHFGPNAALRRIG